MSFRNSPPDAPFQPLNPLAPEARGTPSAASIYQTFNLILVGSLSVLTWDILESCWEDWAVVFHRKFTLQTVVFIVSRFSTFGYLITSAIISTPIDANTCTAGVTASHVFFNLGLALINTLFYFRVCAVYHGNRWIEWGFLVFLIGLIAAGVYTFFTATSPSYSILTRQCHLVVEKSYLVVLPALQGSYDFIVCLAISYRLAGKINIRGILIHVKNLIMRKRNSRVHRFRLRFMHDSQLYFIITACIKIPALISYGVFRPTTDRSSLQLATSFPDIVVSSIMAAKIYRRLRLGKPGLLPQTPTTLAALTSLDNIGFEKSTIAATSSTAPSSKPASSRFTYPPLPRPPPEYNPDRKTQVIAQRHSVPDLNESHTLLS